MDDLLAKLIVGVTVVIVAVSFFSLLKFVGIGIIKLNAAIWRLVAYGRYTKEFRRVAAKEAYLPPRVRSCIHPFGWFSFIIFAIPWPFMFFAKAAGWIGQGPQAMGPLEILALCMILSPMYAGACLYLGKRAKFPGFLWSTDGSFPGPFDRRLREEDEAHVQRCVARLSESLRLGTSEVPGITQYRHYWRALFNSEYMQGSLSQGKVLTPALVAEVQADLESAEEGTETDPLLEDRLVLLRENLRRTLGAQTGMAQSPILGGGNRLEEGEGGGGGDGKAAQEPIHIKCPSCGLPLRLPQRYRGKKGKCPKCRGLINIPS